MAHSLSLTETRTNPARWNAALFLTAALLLFVAGCKKQERVQDPELVPIQEMLDAQLPQGSTRERVVTFLNTRGYKIDSGEPGTVVGIIRHINTKTIQPVTARVIFYFDATGKLNTTEIRRIFNQPIH